jgi:hypothetical protein
VSGRLRSFFIPVTAYNGWSIDKNLTTATYITFTSGSYYYKAFLKNPTTVPAKGTAKLSFDFVTVPLGMTNGQYKLNVVYTDGTGNDPAFTVGDPITLNNPTAIRLLSFNCIGLPGRVECGWATASEIENIGFALYRSINKYGPYSRISPSLIPTQAQGAMGSVYKFTDWDIVPAQAYFYKLADVDIHGKETLHGPILAIPLPPSTSKDGITLLSAEKGQMVFSVSVDTSELSIENLLREGSSYQRLSLPGYSPSSRMGKPLLPQKSVLLGIPEASGVRVEILSEEAESQGGYKLLKAAPIDSLSSTLEGLSEEDQALLANIESFQRSLEENNPIPGFYPASSIEIGHNGYLRNQRVVQLLLSPIQYNEATGEIRIVKKLRFALILDGAKETGPSIEALLDPLESLYTSLFNYEEARKWRIKR